MVLAQPGQLYESLLLYHPLKDIRPFVKIGYKYLWKNSLMKIMNYPLMKVAITFEIC